MNDADRETMRLAAAALEDLEVRRYPLVGILRQLYRRAAELVASAPADDRCPEDGRPVAQPATGRRRVYCSATCRRKAARRRARERGR